MEKIKKIIHGCQKNDSSSQKQLYNMFSAKMFSICLRYSKDYTEAEDNLQEGFIKIFTKINNYRSEGSFEGWMRRIIVNTAIESLRKKNPLYSVENIETYEDNLISDDITVKINTKDLLNLIQTLPPQYKLVFNLYVIEGFNHDEISELLSISTGTSKSNLFRARKWLANKLDNNEKETSEQKAC